MKAKVVVISLLLVTMIVAIAWYMGDGSFAYAQKEKNYLNHLICKPVEGPLENMYASPDASYVVSIRHEKKDTITPFHIYIDDRLVEKVSLLYPYGFSFVQDASAFAWWKYTSKGWIPVVTTVEGKSKSVVKEPYNSIVYYSGGWHNMSLTTTVGSSSITVYYDNEGFAHVGGEPKGSRIAGNFLSINPKTKNLALFEGKYKDGVITSWWVTKENNHYGPYPWVWFGSLMYNPQGSMLSFAVHRKEGWFVMVNNKEYGPYNDIGRVSFDKEGRNAVWCGKIEQGTYLFVNGKKGPGPFEEVLGYRFLDSGQLAYVVKNDEKCIAVTPQKEFELPIFDYVLGPLMSPEGTYVAGVIAEKRHPWFSEVVVNGECLWGPYDAFMEVLEGGRSRLKKHGVLGLAWSRTKNGDEILSAIVNTKRGIERIQKVFSSDN